MIDRERFMKKVRVTPGPLETPCWIWKGKTDRGYGRFDLDGRKQRAHIVAYRTWRGEVPPGLVLDHLCRNRACSNPAHLEPVTNRVNVLRGENHVAKRARTTHCPSGHAYSAENTYRDAQNRRYCRACRRERARTKRVAA
jgi:hypothetical protein